MNERITEDLIKSRLKELGYKNIDEQKSTNKKVQELLKTASKNGSGSVGRPEFIIVEKNSDYVIVVECKPDTKFHDSENQTNRQAVKYAVDGALHYASKLKDFFNVIAIAASGQNEEELIISNYFWKKGTEECSVILDKKGSCLSSIVDFKDYKKLIERDIAEEELSFNKLIEFSRKIHEYMYANAKLSEAEKPLLVSGILIALNNQGFKNSYKNYEGNPLAIQLTTAIQTELKSANIPDQKLSNMIHTYSFISNHPNLSVEGINGDYSPLRHIIDKIKENVSQYITSEHNYDAIGHFYGEFLKYTGGDKKGLGIVLTPRHITNLFSELVTLTPNTKVLDTCAGTAGFLISAMSKMTSKATGEDDIINIKKNCLYGVELQPNMYTLACANMILRGDGQANIYQGSCFDESITKELKEKEIDYAFINPPYSQKGVGLHELDFIYHTLNILKPGGKLITIVPMSCAIQIHKTKEKLFKKHRLEAVMSMPDELFYPVGTVTCIMVFEAHIPHDTEEDYKTWFGYWKKDGYVKSKKFGRSDMNNEWDAIKKSWLEAYRNKETIPELSIKVKVEANDEWCAEAYLETDYSTLAEEDFLAEVKKYALFKLANAELFEGEV
ncbi:MAG: N-6 DNA methylase [Sulfuricurvum sp.]|nr:N-6 DNA methylase [Sulfuricurvum sp.]MDD5387556.1 N-6 DNA methylase [Sulfuricurvum sp.]